MLVHLLARVLSQNGLLLSNHITHTEKVVLHIILMLYHPLNLHKVWSRAWERSRAGCRLSALTIVSSEVSNIFVVFLDLVQCIDEVKLVNQVSWLWLRDLRF